MNLDKDEQDVRFVADRLKLNYPTLEAQWLDRKYSIRALRTFIIVDQNSVVRAQHVGYSPKLREEAIGTIDGLLAAIP
jgi:hypothetical protein